MMYLIIFYFLPAILCIAGCYLTPKNEWEEDIGEFSFVSPNMMKCVCVFISLIPVINIIFLTTCFHFSFSIEKD